MFGKLTLDAIPMHEPIIMGTLVVVLLGGAALFGAITYHRKWTYLWREWICSVDHKRVGVMYIIMALVMLLRGFADAIMMRTQQAIAVGETAGYLPPHHYDQIFTAHGVIMIFFVATPFILGLMNVIVPLQIGARDVAYPFVNSLSFWLSAIGAVLVMISMFVGDFAATGWVAYPPLSGLEYSPTVGVDYYIWALQISGLGTTLTGINFIVTILRMRAPGLTLMKMPVFTWTALITNILIVAIFPVLTATLALLTADRYLDMHFFTSELGGNAMMYVNLIWIWGHPEVYVLILPCFGAFSEIIATFSRKPLFGYKSMVYATSSIGVLSFFVWLHHFFTMGSGASVNAFFGIMTSIISIPTGVKLFNWLFTMYRGRIRFHSSTLWTIGFMVTFAVGGMTGVLLAVPGADFVLHNSLFLIAHFHNVIIGGVVFGCLAAMSFWFPKVFGFTLNEFWGKVAFWCWLIGFYLAFMPLYALGLMGMTRRMNHYTNPEWQPYLIVALVGACIIGAGILAILWQLYVSVRDRNQNRDLTGDPWDGRSLEWATASPAPFYNFAHVPNITSLEQHWEDKDTGRAYAQPARYEDIHMPRNTSAGFLVSVFGLVFCFGFVWHIWWMVGFGLAAMIFTFIARAYDRDVDYYVPAAEVERIERARFQQLQGSN
ncbi:cytochrome o ubiquinol oxidase subunit I [Cupriavidus metallidurans]|jgi:cytochrome o ubiquinol oxidase subunit 1|uniref:Cytochrome o ubiquinol oxidase subunit I n=1 Tax=Cupriavidus metallidurans (strain ATCC 43123 / DSM 2839 / NBRC 102507 / CH34) TaxID=266264 RepID=Q1LB25_CUPMC|nr:cytochrome o ubiquinol oxidase subunit I [Cupriavidus metallidurans]ABF12651.1 cytochrome o ubiquinol oxidase subunit I [Cupriavidus metallidurans CH34]AVA35313.1 cytochrome o ubiquinol oxidase subunit I [Cupriavidus metallidurans]KWW33091.1 Cytochrome bo(3) ubiquinol oxidase subunit 1 [Cupriavidus metallidurans]MDE4921079.1 cytochrome o ubiquinol oxidase subunit I [Cupriavidus metallidurans]QGS32155.1 cytochrome o ubiquinol oxidase subunit I [Cupriavidus metallidurans]